MYKEVNTGTNLPAQMNLYSVDGDEYKFLCIAKGGGSANKTYLYRGNQSAAHPGQAEELQSRKCVLSVRLHARRTTSRCDWRYLG